MKVTIKRAKGHSYKEVRFDGVLVGRIAGYRNRDWKGVDADYWIMDAEGNVIAEGYAYYRDAVKMAPVLIEEHLKKQPQ